jgi:hypothetical protein
MIPYSRYTTESSEDRGVIPPKEDTRVAEPYELLQPKISDEQYDGRELHPTSHEVDDQKAVADLHAKHMIYAGHHYVDTHPGQEIISHEYMHPLMVRSHDYPAPEEHPLFKLGELSGDKPFLGDYGAYTHLAVTPHGEAFAYPMADFPLHHP